MPFLNRRCPCLVILCSAGSLWAQASPAVVTEDVDRFWQAYDRIVATSDTGERRRLLQTMFLDRATPGQAAMIRARRYTADQYLAAIDRYPKFWRSIRANTLRAPRLAEEIGRGVAQLRSVYPALRRPPVYFTIGVFRSGGTTLDGMVLIGSELALADSTTDGSEMPASLQYVRDYFTTNPIREVAPLNVHEVVHTQQRDHAYQLLPRSLYEGIAEFVAVVATDRPSSSPAIEFGRRNHPRIRDRFEAVLLSPHAVDAWLYNDANNEFGLRDLGYAVGYGIAERYVARAVDRGRAIGELIELDYADVGAVARVVDRSQFFSRPLGELIRRYEASRPTVVAVRGVRNGARGATPGVVRLTLQFSAPLAREYHRFEPAPLGEESAIKVRQFLGFSPDGRSAEVEVELAPQRRLQLLLGEDFRTSSGLPLRPFLVEVTTR